jgi:hypothetical protein
MDWRVFEAITTAVRGKGVAIYRRSPLQLAGATGPRRMHSDMSANENEKGY